MYPTRFCIESIMAAEMKQFPKVEKLSALTKSAIDAIDEKHRMGSRGCVNIDFMTKLAEVIMPLNVNSELTQRYITCGGMHAIRTIPEFCRLARECVDTIDDPEELESCPSLIGINADKVRGVILWYTGGLTFGSPELKELAAISADLKALYDECMPSSDEEE